jgi:DNA-binding transcriptional ArsR family regulator
MNPSSSRARDLLACLGDSSRFRLVLHLLESERCASDLALDVGLSQSCTTRHLQVLERAGIVCGARDGKRVLFRLCREKPNVDGLIVWALREAEALEVGSGLSSRTEAGITKSRARAARSGVQTRLRGTNDTAPARGQASQAGTPGGDVHAESSALELTPVSAEPSDQDSDGEAPLSPLRRSEFEDYLL